MTTPKNIKESDAPINILPEYRIRTMKDDLAEVGLEKLKKEAKVSPPEKLPIVSETPKVPKPPKPPKPEPAPEPIPEPVKIEPAKPKKKNRLLPALLIILIIVAIGGFFYWMGTKPESEPEPTTPEQPQASETLIQVDEIKILSLSNEIILVELIKQEAGKSQTIETFKRIAILKNEAEFLSLNELLKELNIKIPPYALAELKDNYTLVVYSQDGKRRLGLVIETKNADNLKEQLRFWEQTMVNDLKPIFLESPITISTDSVFRDDEYSGIAFRYIKLPESLLGIAYGFIDNKLLIATSKESFRSSINRLVK